MGTKKKRKWPRAGTKSARTIDRAFHATKGEGKNRKQRVAIALAKARKAGARIPKAPKRTGLRKR